MVQESTQASKTARRPTLEEKFLEAWEEHSIFGPEGMPQREVNFDDTCRAWDFAWPRVKVAVEIQGFGRGGRMGGHQTPRGMAADATKFRDGLALGWVIIPFTSACIGSKEKLCDAVSFVSDIISRGTAE